MRSLDPENHDTDFAPARKHSKSKKCAESVTYMQRRPQNQSLEAITLRQYDREAEIFRVQKVSVLWQDEARRTLSGRDRKHKRTPQNFLRLRCRRHSYGVNFKKVGRKHKPRLSYRLLR
jgi:hypothetical protein